MIQQRLLEWIQHPECLDKDSLYELRSILARYPYFQTARLLYLKNMFLMQDPAFKEELKRSALYVADLSLLFYYIEGERFVIKKHPLVGTEPESAGPDRTLDLIDRFLSGLPDLPSEDRLPVPAEVNVDYTSILLQEDSPETEEVTAPLKGQELIDSFIGRDKDTKSGENVTVSETHDPLPEQAAPEAEPEDDVSAQNDDTDERYFTETLAKIYVKQQRYDKALEIIKKLNLKYPKKNTYFADQIRFLEKLIINAKSK